MSDENPGNDTKTNDEEPLDPGVVRLKPVGQKTVPHNEHATPAPEEKQIHPRRPLRIVPESAEQPGERKNSEKED